MYQYGILLDCFGQVYKDILESKDKICNSTSTLDIIQNISREFALKIIDIKKHIINKLNKLNDNYIIDKFIYALCSFYDHMAMNMALQKSIERAIIAGMWNSISLEVQIFQTSCAGQKLFQDIEEVMQYHYDQIRDEMLKVYFNIVNLYTLSNHMQDKIKIYKTKVFKKLYNNSYDINLFECNHIAARAHSIKHNYNRWIICGLIIFYYITTSMVWSYAISPMHSKIDCIIREF